MFLTFIMLLFCTVQSHARVVAIICGSISKGVSFILSIACRLLYYLIELAVLLLKFNLGDIFIEAHYRCFVAPHKYFNGVAAVCIVAHRLSVCACMQSGSACNIQ